MLTSDQVSLAVVEDAYNVMLTCDSFVSNQVGVSNSPIKTSTKVIATKGSNIVNATVLTSQINIPKNGIITVTSDEATPSPTLTLTFVNVYGNNLIEIPIQVGSQIFTKTFSYTYAKTGYDGDDGKDGVDADYVTIFITSEQGTIFKTATSVTLVATVMVNGVAIDAPDLSDTPINGKYYRLCWFEASDLTTVLATNESSYVAYVTDNKSYVAGLVELDQS